MTDLSPEARELLRKARTAFSPRQDRLQAVRSALEAQLAASQGPSPGTSSPASGAATRALAGTGWGIAHPVATAVVIGALGAGGIATWLMVDRPNLVSSMPAVAPAPPTGPAARAEPAEEGALPSNPPSVNPTPTWQSTPSDPPPSSKLSLAPRDRTRGGASGAAKTRPRGESPREGLSEPALPAAVPPPAEATDSLAEEVRLLKDARSALDRGDATQALRLLDAHEKRFQRGTLYEERLATRVQALCALGLVDGARSTAQELERAAPRSPHLGRVRSSCIAQPTSK